MKLTYLTLEQVRTISGLAERAQSAQDRLIDRLNKADIVGVNEGTPARDEADKTWSAAADAPRETDLAGPMQIPEMAISRLPADARQELFAIALIGRGDNAAPEWDDAVAEAVSLSDESQTRMIAEMDSLPALLSKGLYQLRLA